MKTWKQIDTPNRRRYISFEREIDFSGTTFVEFIEMLVTVTMGEPSVTVKKMQMFTDRFQSYVSEMDEADTDFNSILDVEMKKFMNMRVQDE